MMPSRYEAAGPAAGIDARQGQGDFAPAGLEVSTERVLRVLGYRRDAPAGTEVRGTAQAMAELAVAAATPRATYRRLAIDRCTREGLVLSTGTRFRGPTFAAYLAGCDEVAVFVLSLGARFDSTQKNLSAAGKALEAYVMDIAGWLGIEEATRLLKRRLDEEAKRDGLELTRRLAPGYTSRVGGQKVEWPLEDHPALFSLFDEAAPARLLEGGCAMTPKMSRSGLFGLRAAPGNSIPDA